ncbi:MAG: HlyD family efflux transporter periplasmic adaptor subunit [Calditrichaeota bacterium]|nr:HlyD family efflux transporter periplasmic adaptor subunit [Calditrichota bacterium]
MKRTLIIISGFALALSFVSCKNGKDSSFAYNGRLDADVLRLSAKVPGTVDSLTVDEGDAVRKGDLLVKINTDRVELQLQQQQAQLSEIETNLQALKAKIRQVKSQLEFNRQTLAKTEKMLQQGAATEQQRDQLATQVKVLQAQLDEIMTNKKLIASKSEQLQAAIKITRLTLRDARVISPINGIVINRFVDRFELAAPGTVLLELADLSSLEATIYVPLTKLNKIKIGEKAQIKVDGTDKTFAAKVKWISSVAEFTPKTILTEETRTTLVYAVKLDVANPDGALKIGMPVEVVLD